jgi:hypothetical protein
MKYLYSKEIYALAAGEDLKRRGFTYTVSYDIEEKAYVLNYRLSRARKPKPEEE